MAEKITKIIKRDGIVVRYDRERITCAIYKASCAQGACDRGLAETAAARVEDKLLAMYGDRALPTVEDIQDVVENTLMELGQTNMARRYIIYRHERAKARNERADFFEGTDTIPYKKIYEVLRWNVTHRCSSIAEINALIARGKFPELVRDAHRRYEDEVTAAAEKIMARGDDVRVVIIAGPSSSGKTTTTIKLGERLMAQGRELKAINVDHYFFDLEMHPRDEFGDYDYETPQALDLNLINEHLGRLIDGAPVKTPHYDFKTGKRMLNVHDLQLESHQVLLIDSLHGLYDDMTCAIPARNKFRFYVETLGQLRNDEGQFLRWADNRLMRRMVRDSLFRKLQPLNTLTHWHYVRSSEMKNIIPFIHTADFLLNSALPYELPILKQHVFSVFPEALSLYKAEPKRQDAYLRARRIYGLLAPLTEIEDDSAVPPDALLREFIGGSCYSY